MERTQRIVDRLPAFYRVWDPESVMYKLIDAIGRGLEEPHKDLGLIIRSHWVDTAFGDDLDSLGSIFDLSRNSTEADSDYRARIKGAVQGFRGGGTRETILGLVGLFLGLRPGERLELSENPPAYLVVEKGVLSGDTWMMGSMSIDDATPSIEIAVEGEGLEVVDPVLTNSETGDQLKFRGELRSGQRLLVSDRTTQLDGLDVSDKVTTKTMPRLLRGGSQWQFEEALSAKVGRFDRSSFDESVFAVALPTTTIQFGWTARQPATFELKVPSSALARNGLTKEDLASFVNIIKAAGIKAIISVSEQ
jgi:hypothetical protein